MKTVDVNELQRVVDYDTPLAEIIWMDGDKPAHSGVLVDGLVTQEVTRSWRFVGLSNKEFARVHGLITD